MTDSRTHLVRGALDLADATRGIDWDATRTQTAIDSILDSINLASHAALEEATAALVERLRASRIEEADGVAYVALTCGSVVEAGASPEPLATVLRERMPEVLAAARRYADRCLADLPEEPTDEERDDAWLEVDRRGITRELFAAHLEADRGGGAALVNLRSWSLPAIASWTRHRRSLEAAIADAELVSRAASLHASEATFLDRLLGAELDATWNIALPVDGRVFEVAVDGLVSNWDFHALLADALAGYGVDVAQNDAVALESLRSDVAAVTGHFTGTWNLYDPRAARFDLREGARVPTDFWVSGEGTPRDIPRFEGRRTVLLGPPSLQRGWSSQRVFQRLFANVEVARELDTASAREFLGRLRESAG